MFFGQGFFREKSPEKSVAPANAGAVRVAIVISSGFAARDLNINQL
jgi:hypothetical protein